MYIHTVATGNRGFPVFVRHDILELVLQEQSIPPRTLQTFLIISVSGIPWQSWNQHRRDNYCATIILAHFTLDRKRVIVESKYRE